MAEPSGEQRLADGRTLIMTRIHHLGIVSSRGESLFILRFLAERAASGAPENGDTNTDIFPA